MFLSSYVPISKKSLFICLLFICTFLSFSPVLKAQFLSYKDDVALTNNVNVLNFDLSHINAAFGHRVDGFYTPLTTLSFSIEHKFFGFNPFVYHLDNLLLHIAVVILVFFFAINLGLSITEAFLGALVFALLPSQVETVAWLAQRKELLYALFYLLSLIYYQKGRMRKSFVFASLSLLASPEALSLPFALIAVDYFKNKKLELQKIISKWHYFLISIAIGSLSYKVFLSLVKISSFDHLFKAHFFYLPSVILCLMVACGINALYQFLKSQEAIIRQLFVVAVIVLVMGLMLLTFQQSSIWQDTITFWKYQSKILPRGIVLNHLAEALKDTKEYQRSLDDYRAYLDLVSHGAKDSSIVLDKAKFNKVEEVIGIYKQAIKAEPDYGESYYHLANIYEDLGKLDEAFIWYHKALEMHSNSKEALFGLGLLYQRTNNVPVAIDTFNRLLKNYPEDEEVYARIIKAYSKAIDDNPQQRDYQEQREDVLSKYEQISKRKKYTYSNYFNLGYLYEQVGGYEEAIRFYKKAIELKPDYDKALINLANRFQLQGDLKTALLMYQQLLHFHPKNSQGYLKMGVIYNALGDADRSRMLYQKAVDLDPSNAKAYFYLGYLCESAGELKDALNYYEKSVENDSSQDEVYYNMGNVYAQLGQEAEAMASYLKTIGINKNHQNAFVNLSILSFKSRDFAGAVHYLEEAQLLGYVPPAEFVKSLEPYRKKNK